MVVNRVVTQASTAAVDPEDMEELSRWVKKNLFGRVKIIYRPEEDLKTEGTLFWLFARECKDKLRGLSHITDANSRKMYVKMLWAEAMSRPNLVSEGLAVKRSTVYTSMHNQWVGKQQRGLCGTYLYVMSNQSFCYF